MRNHIIFQLAIFSILSAVVYSQTALTYQTPALEWIFTPLNEAGAAAPLSGTYMKELKKGTSRLIKGWYTTPSITKATSLYNGYIFEGDEIAVSPPDSSLNLGTSFGLGMWLYITKITGSHTLFCR